MEENNYKELSRSLLSKDSLLIDKKIMKLYGIEVALFLASLIQKEEYFEKQNMLKEFENLSGKWFSCTQRAFEIDTGLTPYLQLQSSKILQKIGVLNIKKKDLPAKNYFQINYFNYFKGVQQNDR